MQRHCDLVQPSAIMLVSLVPCVRVPHSRRFDPSRQVAAVINLLGSSFSASVLRIFQMETKSFSACEHGAKAAISTRTFSCSVLHIIAVITTTAEAPTRQRKELYLCNHPGIGDALKRIVSESMRYQVIYLVIFAAPNQHVTLVTELRPICWLEVAH